MVAFLVGLEALGFIALAGADTALNPQASVAGLGIRIERMAWLLDQMEHGHKTPMPASMMPDMPEHGLQRLNVEISLYNDGKERQLFQASELRLRSSAGHNWLPCFATVETMVLSAGQSAHLFLNFDVPSMEEAELQLIWQRGGTEKATPVPASTHIPLHHASGHQQIERKDILLREVSP